MVSAQSRVITHFWVTPLDCGISTLKSDKYLQFAEAAQVDYLAKTRLFHTLLRDGLRFVNASQLVKFSRPVGMFQRVRIETAIVFADNSLHASTLGTRRLRQCENNFARITSIHLRRPYACNGAVGAVAAVRR